MFISSPRHRWEELLFIKTSSKLANGYPKPYPSHDSKRLETIVLGKKLGFLTKKNGARKFGVI
jgi:hypothetical protein